MTDFLRDDTKEKLPTLALILLIASKLYTPWQVKASAVKKLNCSMTQSSEFSSKEKEIWHVQANHYKGKLQLRQIKQNDNLLNFRH